MYNEHTGAHEFHYQIEHLYPPDPKEGGLSMWGFNITMCGKFANKLANMTLDPERAETYRTKNLNPIIRNLWNYTEDKEYVYDIHSCEPRLQFGYGDGNCLLTNLTVPGNACGLDMEHGSYEEAKSGQTDLKGNFMPVVYRPHNVDHRDQALALLIVFNEWYRVALYHGVQKEDEKTNV